MPNSFLLPVLRVAHGRSDGGPSYAEAVREAMKAGG